MAPPLPKGASKKTEQKVKAKIIEDKTFGLKNKNKSTKVNKYIAAVEQTVKSGGDRKARKAEEDAKKEREAKKEAEREKAELAKIFKPVMQVQKVPFGVDPKTVLCQYFKAGQCSKGDKCKFSHDPEQERKSTKINLYQDNRESVGEEGGAAVTTEDSMADWDQSKLEQVITRKHGPGVKTTTEIVCKHFLDAIESGKYGWFWECPNGGDKCKYRHALPPGFVLKQTDKSGSKEDKQEISLEEFLETERYKIKKETPVTAESFARWKLDRQKRAEEEELKSRRAREAEVKAGRLGNVSGRDLFVYQPDLFHDDDEAMDVDYSGRVENEVEEVEDADVFLAENLDDLEISSKRRVIVRRRVIMRRK